MRQPNGGITEFGSECDGKLIYTCMALQQIWGVTDCTTHTRMAAPDLKYNLEREGVKKAELEESSHATP